MFGAATEVDEYNKCKPKHDSIATVNTHVRTIPLPQICGAHIFAKEPSRLAFFWSLKHIHAFVEKAILVENLDFRGSNNLSLWNDEQSHNCSEMTTIEVASNSVHQEIRSSQYNVHKMCNTTKRLTKLYKSEIIHFSVIFNFEHFRVIAKNFENSITRIAKPKQQRIGVCCEVRS